MTDSPAELVHLEVEGPLATITLDSPHNRNALSKQLVTELAKGVDPYLGRKGVVMRAYRSTLDDRLQPYVVFVPRSYGPKK